MRHTVPNLNREELSAIDAAIGEAANVVQYQAARFGIREYRRTRTRIRNVTGRPAPIAWRHVARAALTSLRFVSPGGEAIVVDSG